MKRPLPDNAKPQWPPERWDKQKQAWVPIVPTFYTDVRKGPGQSDAARVLRRGE